MGRGESADEDRTAMSAQMEPLEAVPSDYDLQPLGGAGLGPVTLLSLRCLSTCHPSAVFTLRAAPFLAPYFDIPAATFKGVTGGVLLGLPGGIEEEDDQPVACSAFVRPLPTTNSSTQALGAPYCYSCKSTLCVHAHMLDALMLAVESGEPWALRVQSTLARAPRRLRKQKMNTESYGYIERNKDGSLATLALSLGAEIVLHENPALAASGDIYPYYERSLVIDTDMAGCDICGTQGCGAYQLALHERTASSFPARLSHIPFTHERREDTLHLDYQDTLLDGYPLTLRLSFQEETVLPFALFLQEGQVEYLLASEPFSLHTNGENLICRVCNDPCYMQELWKKRAELGL